MQKNRVLLITLLLLGASIAADAKESKKKKPTWFQSIGNVLPESKQSAEVAGVRGLEADGDVQIVGSEARDYAAMDELESLVISEEDVKQFIAEGSLR